MSLKSFKVLLKLFILSFLCLHNNSASQNVLTKYEPNWTSLEKRPVPQWFDSAKIGIFIHWGVFSVPSVTSEWFWFDWKYPDHNKNLHNVTETFMKKNYKPNFSYQDFAEDFTAEFFDSNDWASIIEKSGAKYIVLTSKHHEGFALWPSKYSYNWNSFDVGPKRDIVGELSETLRNNNYSLRFGLYHSLYEWFNPIYELDKANNFTSKDFVNNKIFPEMKELVEKYKPEIFWSDGEAEAPSSYWRSEEFIAWLYNESPVAETVVVNDRWGIGTSCHHGGYFTCADRFTPGKLQQRKWENAMTIDKNSWGYNRRSNVHDYLTNRELISMLVETVAFGGNLLVNIAPTKDGKIPPIYEERLLTMGEWLAMNGEAIYGSHPWKVCQNETKLPDVWYTTSFSGELFVILLRWPKTSEVSCPIPSDKTTVTLLGYDRKSLDWTITATGLLQIYLPEKSEVNGLYGWALRISNTLN